MIVHVPTIKQLQYLVALRRYGHFGKAAEASFVTQSTLSAGLRELVIEESYNGRTKVTRRDVRVKMGPKLAALSRLLSLLPADGAPMASQPAS